MINNKKPTLLYCGTSPELVQHLGNIIHFPTIQIQPKPLTQEEQKQLIHHWHTHDIIIFTSQYAVEYFCAFIIDHDDINIIGHKKVCIIGKHTENAYLKYSGFTPAIIAKTETGAGLIKELKPYSTSLKNQHILFPRSTLPNPYIAETLNNDFHAHVTMVPIYTNSKPPKRTLPIEPIDGIIFTSPSTVVNYISDYKTIPEHWSIWAKGPVTQRKLLDYGYKGQIINESE